MLSGELNQINPEDVKMLDVSWQMAMAVFRAKKFMATTGRNVWKDQDKIRMGFDKSKLRCFNCNEYGNFARECTKPKKKKPEEKKARDGKGKAETKALVVQDCGKYQWASQVKELSLTRTMIAKMENDDEEEHAFVVTEEKLGDEEENLVEEKEAFAAEVDKTKVDELKHQNNELQVKLDVNQMRNKRMLDAGKAFSTCITDVRFGKDKGGIGISFSEKNKNSVPQHVSRDIIGPPIDSVLVGVKPMTEEELENEKHITYGLDEVRIKYVSGKDVDCLRVKECHESRSLISDLPKDDVLASVSELNASKSKQSMLSMSSKRVSNSNEVVNGFKIHVPNTKAGRESKPKEFVPYPQVVSTFNRTNKSKSEQFCLITQPKKVPTHLIHKWDDKPEWKSSYPRHSYVCSHVNGPRITNCFQCEKPRHFAANCLNGPYQPYYSQNPRTSMLQKMMAGENKNQKQQALSQGKQSSKPMKTQRSKGPKTKRFSQPKGKTKVKKQVSKSKDVSQTKQVVQTELKLEWSPVNKHTDTKVTSPQKKPATVQDFNGGGVSFVGGVGGRISKKGVVKNGSLTFSDVHYVEELSHSLLSVPQICDREYYVLFNNKECIILKPGVKIPEECVLMRTPRRGNSYLLNMGNPPPSDVACFISKQNENLALLWHWRLGHANMKNLTKLAKGEHVRNIPIKDFTSIEKCVAFAKGKQHKLPQRSKMTNSISSVLQLLHMDLCGPMQVLTLVKQFVTLMENQMSKKVKAIRSDNGTEFKNAELNMFCGEKGIERQYSAPYTPQQNGVAERRNRTLIKAARTMLCEARLPIFFWAEAVNTACYVQNRADECYFVGYSANSAYRVYNKTTKVIVEAFNVDWLEDNPTDAGTGPDRIFDYGSLFEGFNFSNMFPSLGEEEDIIAPAPEVRSSVENVSDSVLAAAPKDDNVDVPESSGTHDDQKESETQGMNDNVDDTNLHVSISVPDVQATRINRDHPLSNVVGPVSAGVTTRSRVGDINFCMYSCFISQIEPPNVMVALKDLSWMEAMHDELNQFSKLGVWHLVKRPDNKKVIHTRWLYKNKKDDTGVIVRNKARLIIQGHRQVYGIDYDKVYAPVARLEAIQIFLVVATYLNFTVHQMDVKTTFL
ncbi:hypothetical protein SSX86_008322 [Deinandra increscens subsp. villosa]|uniref:Integrase catalytic domain-containing protein n=1 Tax=Deinandra increscens subsp. villosa TaxID=3103831 RepID=A0AAP0DB25_9ASTR